MTGTPPAPDRIMQLAAGYWSTGILGAAAGCSLFTHLDAGADTAARLAERAGVAERGVQTLLDGLVALGLVEVRDGSYRNTAEASTYLVEGRPACLSSFATFKLAEMGRLGALSEVVRSGGPVRDVTTEVVDNPHWAQVVQAIAAQSVPVAELAAAELGLADAGPISVLDIGGGSGIYSASWLALNPQARAVQLDWAPINDIARKLVADRGVADRFTCVDGDFHDTDLGTAAHDVVVYSHIAHQEGPVGNIAMFTRIRAALKPGGTLVIGDYVVADDRSGPPFPLIFAAEMLVKSQQGGTWRRSDYRDWLVEAGFTDIVFRSTQSPTTLVFAR